MTTVISLCNFVKKRRFMGLACRSIVEALLLEMGTLIGARTASPLAPDDWKPFRILVYFSVSLIIHLYIDWYHRAGNCLLSKDDKKLGTLLIENKNSICFSAAIASVIGLLLHAIWSTTSFCDWRLELVIAMLVFSVLLVIANWSLLKNRIEILFLGLSIPMGIALLVYLPFVPEITWDGQIHYANSNCLSYLGDAEFTEVELMMAGPDVVDRLDLLASGDIASSWKPKKDLISQEKAERTVESYDDSNAFIYHHFSNPYGSNIVSAATVGYIPCAVGLWLGRLLHLTVLNRLLMARAIQYLFYITTIYMSIRHLKSGQMMVLVLGLLLTPLTMAAGFTYDTWGYCLIIYSFTYYFGKLQTGDGSIGDFDWFTILLTFCLGAMVKAINFPLAALFLLAPKRCFRGKSLKKFRCYYVILAMLFLLASFLLPMVIATSTGTEKPDLRGGDAVSPSGQIRYALSHPLSFAGILLRFTYSFISSSRLPETIGSYYSYLFIAPDLLGYLAWLLAIFACCFDSRDIEACYCSFLWKLTGFLSVAGSFALSLAALYAAFTPVGANTINGFQWRYLLPYAMPIFFVVLNPGSKFLWRRVDKNYLLVVVIAIEYMYWVAYLYFGFIAGA